MRTAIALCSIAALSLASSALAAISSNAVLVSGSVQVVYDANRGLYTYSYTFANALSSALEVSSVLIPLNGSTVVNVTPPVGWQGSVWSDGSTVQFTATEGVVVPPDYVDTGGLLPSPFQIKPGANLAGFSFDSPDPPDAGSFFAQGFTQVPVLGVDAPDPEDPVLPPSPFDPSLSFNGSVTGPHFSDQLFSGGRRPAVDGFLEFQNLENRQTKVIPVQIDVVFGVNGESVNQSSFRAVLNNQDVTASFFSTGPHSLRAVFSQGDPALHVGSRNVLLTMVDGIVPGTTRTATDVDRLTFTAVPP
jgi:hypothetical protein